MNRQVRRAEEKKERRQEREKEKAKAERQARRRERAAARKAAPAKRDAERDDEKAGEAAAGDRARRRGSDPGRFSGALMTATVFFIVLQAVTPSDGTLATQAVAASFYLLFGYFAVLWMFRRGTPRPIAIAVGIGAVLWIGTGLSQWLQPGLEPAPVMLALIPPLLVAGAFLGRVVYRNAPG